MSGISHQKGSPNKRWHMAHTPTTERAFDVLVCRAGTGHRVSMEWATQGGLRTGGLIAWCETCGEPLPASTATPATPDATREKRQEARLTQAMRKDDAQARREYIKRALYQGDRQKDIAERLGITQQRLSQIINGRARKSA